MNLFAMSVKPRKILGIPYVTGFLVLQVLFSVLLSPFSQHQIAYAHTFSTSESAQFLSLVEQIKAEAALINTNLQNNEVRLAQDHAQKAAANLLNNLNLSQIRERNNRIADILETTLIQLKYNVTSLTTGAAAASSQNQIPRDKIASINQTVQSLNDVLGEATTVMVESPQRNNATTWAIALSDLTNTILSNYGDATGSAIDLTDMSNMAGMVGGGNGMAMTLNDSAANIASAMNNSSNMKMSSISRSNMTTMTMITTEANNTTTSMTDTSATIVDAAAYQSAQYLANNTTLQLFNDRLKPLTTSTANGSSSNNNVSTAMSQGAHHNMITGDGGNDSADVTSKLNELETGLMQLGKDINNKASASEVMSIAHTRIHPVLMQLYGLTVAT